MTANSPKDQLKIEVDSDPKHLKAIREQLKGFIAKAGFSAKITESILVAIGEACTNAIRHSYHNQTGHPLRLIAQDFEDKTVFRIQDEGEKIDLTKIKLPELPPKEPGGLGIYFMQTIMDGMEYNTSLSKGNELILTKYKHSGEGL